MNLSDTQKHQLKDWISQGLNLSTIYKYISDQWQIPITYLELRFLIDDLNFEFPKEEEKEEPINEKAEAKTSTDPEELELLHKVTLDVDKIMRPGTLISGSVTFSDGITASWQLDQQGRIGLIPTTEDYRPSQEDIQEFQVQLEEALHKAGY